ncbi:cytochrome c peroxidase [Pontibacter ummariensis]|uniref:Cytochrome c peroxidase n=1 Tax=Pontibacter ummariensis TaxID=1610492 RepID=A0A239I9Y6_9BACT|nr:cytochrome c peroxidase [Pontibacter ummariensis]PRY09976.1 cytochrome c peroxidase [Pontibacter ummariensis]SNS90128.1 cytochrome c peroxidase [Pontibacter ummariensis]
MQTLRNLLLPFLLLIAAFACSPDKEEVEPEVEPFEPTPYELVLPKTFPQNFKVPADNPLTEEGVLLGRHLFYEKRLSGDNTMSCGSCHQQEKAFTDGRALAVGIDGVAHRRSAMSLSNLLWFFLFNWDGSALSLEDQARIPIESEIEMHQSLAEAVKELQATGLYPPLFRKAFGSDTITEERILKAIAQFERTLISADSRYDRYLLDEGTFTEDELEGMKLFMTHPEPGIGLRGGNCGDCHGGVLLSMRTFHNNGLDEVLTDLGYGAVTGREVDKGKFKAPSLRNIALTAPYMHDGRFQTLEEVLDHYNEHIKENSPHLSPLITEATNEVGGKTLLLTEEEKRKIVTFLHTLTDSTFITDKRFSDPFK